MSAENRTIRIGTRGSPLALAQVEMVKHALFQHFADVQVEVVVIRTSGDWRPEDGEVRLSEKDGGKAQFAKEIEEALLAGAIDIAVHSMKDMDSTLPAGLVIDHMLPREDVRDCLLFSRAFADVIDEQQDDVLGQLSGSISVGTVSVRRAAFLLSRQSDLSIEPFRGNVQTRIDKVRDGQVDVSLLALAGLKRLGLEQEADVVLSVEDMLPACGQGAVGIEIREEDSEQDFYNGQSLRGILDNVSDRKTVLCVKAERAALQTLNGSCHSPIGAYAVLDHDDMSLRVKVASLDGRQVFEDEMSAKVSCFEDAEQLGCTLGQRLKQVIPDGVL